MNLPVTDLVISARNGEKQAWDELVERYAPLIWSICRRHRLDGADAEDVGQMVWPHLVDQLDNLRDPAALPGWLATTARRECLRVLQAAAGCAGDRAGHGHRQHAGPRPCPSSMNCSRRAHRCAARGVLRPTSRLSAADRPPHRGPSGAIHRDQRQTRHRGRQHWANPQPLPGQAAPPSGYRRIYRCRHPDDRSDHCIGSGLARRVLGGTSRGQEKRSSVLAVPSSRPGLKSVVPNVASRALAATILI